MDKILRLKEGKKNYNLTLKIGHYENGGLAILAMDETGNCFGKVTINIADYGNILKPYQAFLNNYYYFENLLETLKDANLITETGIVCRYENGEQYPLVTFNKNVLKDYDEENFEEYDAFSEALMDVREMNN